MKNALGYVIIFFYDTSFTTEGNSNLSIVCLIFNSLLGNFYWYTCNKKAMND